MKILDAGGIFREGCYGLYNNQTNRGHVTSSVEVKLNKIVCIDQTNRIRIDSKS